MIDILTTYFDDIKVGVEVVLVLVIIVGFIHTRMLVKRMGVLKKLFNDFKAMEGELDLAVQKALNAFETIQQKMITGEKRMNTLVETAKNIQDDIEAQKADIENVEASLSEVLKQANVMEKALIEQFRNAKEVLKTLETTQQSKAAEAQAPSDSSVEQKAQRPQAGGGPAQNEGAGDSQESNVGKEPSAPGAATNAEGEQGAENTVEPLQNVRKPFPVKGTQNPLMQNRPYARR